MTNRPPLLRTFPLRTDELVVDNFAGGGGASTGIEAAIGRPVDLAVNHDPEAIAMHRANHPATRHYCESIWEVDPREACGSRPVGLAWFSPDCTHFSRAKGNKPREQGIRGLAWVVIRWAREVAPRVIILENVEEFQTWGPLLDDGRPDPGHAGETFREWLGELTALGYEVEFGSLVAADHGAPTTRRRLFLVARRDGCRPAWPEPTHGVGRGRAWRSAAEVIDWAIPCPSIFSRQRPLAEATLRRIAAGIRRYVVETADPFLIPLTHQGEVRTHSINEALRTVTGAHRGELALVAPFITKHYGGVVGHRVDRPLGTVTAIDHHALTTAFLIKYYGAGGQDQDVRGPLHTVTAKARFGLGVVTLASEPYRIVDIGMRMLQPHELFAAQGFPRGYIIAPEHQGRTITKTAQIRLAGNSVCPPLAQAIVAANANAEAA